MTEVETFVKKFHQLWNDGVTAHLDFETRVGEAWIGLRVHLGGQVLFIDQFILFKKKSQERKVLPDSVAVIGEQLLGRQMM